MQQNHKVLRQRLKATLKDGKVILDGDTTLPNLESLLDQSDPEILEIAAAMNDWRGDPVDPEFKTILDTP